MEEKRITSYFKDQGRLIIQRSAREPDGFLAYFAEHEPSEEEILGLLAISSMTSGDFHLGSDFPSPVEALAAISNAAREEICREFRQELKNYIRRIPAA